MTSLRDVESPVLLERFGTLVQRDHESTAALLAHISEIDERKLWAEEGCSSMFSFCIERFHMSESVAAKRIRAARTMRRLPLVGEMVARGELHLTAVCMLAKHLTQDNHHNVLCRARHRTAREIEELIAEIAPRPDAPASVRRAPKRRADPPAQDQGPASGGSLFDQCSKAPEPSADGNSAAASGRADEPADHRRQSRARPEPLSPQRYRIALTVGQSFHDKLGEAQVLLSHRVPSGDMAAVLERSLDALLEKLRKERMAATSRPRTDPNTIGTERSRHVPAAVRRAVWKRDGEQCAYVSPNGRRCTETRWLELHHREPYARGGEHTVEGIELRCRPHNQYQADRDYGRAFMDRKRGPATTRESIERYGRVRIARLSRLHRHPRSLLCPLGLSRLYALHCPSLLRQHGTLPSGANAQVFPHLRRRLSSSTG